MVISHFLFTDQLKGLTVSSGPFPVHNLYTRVALWINGSVSCVVVVSARLPEEIRYYPERGQICFQDWRRAGSLKVHLATPKSIISRFWSIFFRIRSCLIDSVSKCLTGLLDSRISCAFYYQSSA